MTTSSYQPPQKPKHSPAVIDAMPPGKDAALAAIELDKYAGQLGKDARMLRDRSIRAMWQENKKHKGTMTMQQLADSLGVSLGHVRAVCR
jgi:hypothetical protein